MSKWKASAISERGLGHIACGLPCQDVALTGERNATVAIALSDGAGSATQSDIGASLAAKTALDLLLDQFDYLYYSDELNVKKLIIKQIVAMLKERAASDSESLRAYSATLLAVAIKGERYIAIHVGDGVIGALIGDDICVLSYPSNGEHANETIFINSEGAYQDMRLLRARASAVSGFILMSDGSEHSLYDKVGHTLAPAIVKLFAARLDMPQEQFDRELQGLLKEQIVQRTSDDCSIALLVRERKRLRRFYRRFLRQSKVRDAR